MTLIFDDNTLGPLKYYDKSKKLVFVKKFNLFLIFLVFSVSMIMYFDNVAFAQTESAPEPITESQFQTMKKYIFLGLPLMIMAHQSLHIK